MLSSVNVRLYAFRWWWWCRPRAYYLVPLAVLTLLAVQLLAAAVHYLAPSAVEWAGGVAAAGEAGAAAGPAPSVLSPVNSFDPQRGVAFAIAVGGRTERSGQLGDILSVLLEGGALASSIFVFEDVLSRVNGVASAAVAAVASSKGVSVVGSRVDRSRGEDANNFGIGLARHYHFFLDYLLSDAATPNVIARLPPPSPPFDFVVVIEDDLALSPDFVKYFFSMSRVMQADPTLYCAAAHQDNAFLGIHRDDAFDPSTHRATSLSSDQFDFRRGNHFMAPGWMTSRTIYTQIVRPKWLDAALEYSHKVTPTAHTSHTPHSSHMLISRRPRR